MKRFLFLILALCMLLTFFGCGKCKHEFDSGSCEVPPTCVKCGAAEGEAPGHRWVQDSWVEAPVCAVCGQQDASFTAPTLATLGLNANAEANMEIDVRLKSFTMDGEETVAGVMFEPGAVESADRAGYVVRSVRVDTFVSDPDVNVQNFGVGILIEDAKRLDLWDESVLTDGSRYAGTVMHNGAPTEISCNVDSRVATSEEGVHIIYDVHCTMPRDYDGIIVGVYDVSHIVRLGKLWDDDMVLSELVSNGVIDGTTPFFCLR